MHLHYPDYLPITAERERIVRAIRKNQVLVIAGDTGSGKTTQLPKMCLEAGMGKERLIGCTQPRRIAAVSMAARVAEELRQPDLVGHAIRFQDNCSPTTRIKFMTDGLLLAESRKDRILSRYDTIILDEAHERSLNIDFLIGCLKQLLARRSDLKLIISSATIDTEKFSSHFDQAPIITVSGRTWPITMVHVPAEDEDGENYVDQACAAVRELCSRPGGDILVFMPTEQDILDTVRILKSMPDNERHLVLPLFGRLQAADQKKIFRSSKKRKIVVATNVAETSITVPGIRFVVDTGLARIPTYNVRAGTTSMRVQRISRASCDQRAGRCGRTGPGTCIRLYSEEDYQGRQEFTRPEIQRSNLAEVLLQMISLGLGDARTFPFLDPPTGRAIREGFRRLKELGAIDQNHRITKRGRIMARLPLDPAIARIIIEGAQRGALREMIIICSALSIQDPRTRPADREQQAAEAQKVFVDHRSDFLCLLNIWDHWQQFSGGKFSSGRLKKFCTSHYLSWQRMREWFDVHDQILRLLRGLNNFTINTTPAGYGAVHQSLASGLLRNIGKKKEKNIYQTSGDREVVIFPGSVLYNADNVPWIIAADFVETSQVFARTVAAVDARWLEELGGPLCSHRYSQPYWAKKDGQVQAIERVSLFGLPIVAGRRVNYGRISRKAAEEARDIFIHQALIEGQLGGRYRFLQHNRRLQEKLAALEERLRCRSILADDQVLYEFYRQRIGRAYDRFTLNRLLKKKKDHSFLMMREDDICRQRPAREELYRFPLTMPACEYKLPLTYNFQPGTDQDGVTVQIPESLLTRISPTVFEWLVPGLLEEKIVHLLKRLPKKLRRNLVPLPDAVDRIMDRLDLYRGSLYPALEEAIFKEYQLIVRRSDWRTDSLPGHLLMRYQLIDDQGMVLAAGRDFHRLVTDLQGTETGKGRHPAAKAPAGLPEKDDISAKDLAGIPKKIRITGSDGAIRIYFPTLVTNDQQSVNLRFVEDEQVALRQNRQGMQALYCREFPGFSRQLTKDCKASLAAHSASWLALGMRGTLAEIRQALAGFIMDLLFATGSGRIPDPSEFQARVEQLRQEGIHANSAKIFNEITALLAIRRQVAHDIRSMGDQGRPATGIDPALVRDFQECLERILPADFLHHRPGGELCHKKRYLQALSVRMERARHNPGKDALKNKRLTSIMANLARLAALSCHSSECEQAINQYQIMVEEFRVSVFAPELKTSVPVSEKRLQKLWQQIEDLCHRVE